MVARRLYNTEELRFAEPVAALDQSLVLGQPFVMLAKVLECKLYDKGQLSCRQCVEFVMEKEESSKTPVWLAMAKEFKIKESKKLSLYLEESTLESIWGWMEKDISQLEVLAVISWYKSMWSLILTSNETTSTSSRMLIFHLQMPS
jgi:hypothetical protein